MKDRLNFVIVGHVDHGKSTLIGRLLADTNSLPKGKLEQIQKQCEIKGKPFEYAYLLDALQDEQEQGITIDTARVFFRTAKREYIIIDAPGHVEFLKNMISGASRAEAAILLIDAHEGIAENTKRHAYMLSLLGIHQIVVAINKMDLVDYDQKKYMSLKTEYQKFLESIGINPSAYVPIVARDGVNVAHKSQRIKWYTGPTILELIDSFVPQKGEEEKNFRMYVQGCYKFTENGDDRRIVAGTINAGSIQVGDEIVFLPSGKKTRVKTIEVFGKDNLFRAVAGQAIGFTLATQVYVKPSELICKTNEPLPHISDRLKANIVWMGKRPLSIHNTYKLKIGTAKTEIKIESIETVLDASTLEVHTNRKEIQRHEIAQVVINAKKTLAFDIIGEVKDTSRFVIVDEYDIAGGGIIIEALEQSKEEKITHFEEFERELQQLIIKYFPHWGIKSHV